MATPQQRESLRWIEHQWPPSFIWNLLSILRLRGFLL